MAENTKNRLTRMLLSKSRQAQYARVFAVLGICVAVAVAVILHQNGVAMTHEEQVLTCPVTGTVAHTHDQSCYDKDGNLVCPLPERELHVHTDECYTVVKKLTCGKEESDEHKHTDECYTVVKELVCGLEESDEHKHTDACYAPKRELTCKKEEITEEHVHGPGCFTTVIVPNDEAEVAATVEENAEQSTEGVVAESGEGTAEVVKTDEPKADEAEADKDAVAAKDSSAEPDKGSDKAEGAKTADAAMPAQSFVGKVVNQDGKVVLQIEVTAPEGAFPANTTMKIASIDSNDVKDSVEKAVAQKSADGVVKDIQAVDITFYNEAGVEIEPLCPITVSMTSDKIADEDTNPVLVHVEDDGKGEVVDQLSDKQAADRKVETGNNTLAFDADAFSVYVIAYTVDFHWDVDGETYDFSIPGGGFVSLTDLIEVLGIAEGTNSEGDVAKPEESADEDEIMLSGIKVSDRTKKFVADVKSVEFSNADLVWVGKVESDSTVGDLKKANGLDVQYSAELSEEQINEINAQTVKSGDWALISKLPFLSEESLTVTMADGEVFTIDVTDAQDTTLVTLHFVDREGNPLTGFSYHGESIDGSTYAVKTSWAQQQGNIDLADFVKSGYSLSNNHRNTWQDLMPGVSKPGHGSSAQQPHSIIGNELRWNNNALQFREFYTNSDKATYGWYNVGYRPQYFDIDLRQGHGTPQQDNIKDYYLVYGPTTQASDHGDPAPITPPDIGAPNNTKELTSNYDGTFNLELGVSGREAQVSDSNSINVIIVMDTSSSMTRRYDSENQANGDQNTERLANTKKALKKFVTDISAFNNTNANAVELSFITFNRDANSVRLQNVSGDDQYWTTQGTAVTNAINAATTQTGTNWSWALEQANQRLLKHNDGDPTYVLLVTDGAPSQYWHSTVENYYVSGEACYLGARDEARELVRNGATLYGVFAFGPQQDAENDYLGSLVDYAYNAPVRETYRFNVKTPDALEQRLSGILSTIDNTYGFSDVTINDGITELTTVTFENADPESFEYTISYKNYTGTGANDFTTVTLTNGNGLTVSGTGNNQTITVEPQTYKVVKDGRLESVTTEAVTLKGAVFTPKTGNKDKVVTWSLVKSDGGRYILQDGWDYRVKFKIWPSQPSYDLLAVLNNGLITWGEDYSYTDSAGDHTITAEDYKEQIYQDGNGTYILRTNTDTSVTYKKVIEKTVNGHTTYEYEDGTPVPLPEVGGMPLDNTKVQLTKQWNTTLSEDDYQNINDVDLYIIQDPNQEKTTAFNAAYAAWKQSPTDENLAAFEATYYKKVTLNKADDWKAEVSIAPGIYDAERKIKETGHVYTVLEPGIDDHYELEVTPIHPMLDGTTHENERQIYDMIDIYDHKNTTFEMNTNYASVYTVANTLKGGININKEIVNVTSALEQYINMDEYFTIKVTLKDSSGNPVYSPNGYDSGGAVSYRIFAPVGIPEGATVSPEGATGNEVEKYTINGVTYKATKENGTITGFAARGPIPTNGVVELKIRKCDSLRIVNVPLRTKYIVQEIVDDDSGFAYESGHWEVKKSGSVFDGNEQNLTTPITGEKTIVGDAENNVVFRNAPQNVTKDLPIQKQTSDGSGLPGAVFQLLVLTNSGSNVYSPVTEVDGYGNICIDDNTLQTIEVNGAQKESAFTTTGSVQKIKDLPLGKYKLVEVQAPVGYIITNPDTYFEVTTGGVTYKSASEGKLVITNPQGDSLPNTGGSGTERIMALGMMLMLVSGMGIAVKMRNNL